MVSLESDSQVERTTENILEKRNKIEEDEDNCLQRFMWNICRLQILITKVSILFDFRNEVFILTYKIFPKLWIREFKGK